VYHASPSELQLSLEKLLERFWFCSHVTEACTNHARCIYAKPRGTAKSFTHPVRTTLHASGKVLRTWNEITRGYRWHGVCITYHHG
jgi:hypothetical protein